MPGGGGGHPQSAVGSGRAADAAHQQEEGGAASSRSSERNSGKFRFWHDERRFKGGIDNCLVQEALFAAGGVRTGGYPKTAPVSGPLGFQRPGDWDLLWSPARTALKAVPTLRAGQLVSAVPGMYSLTKKRRLSASLKAAYGDEAWQYMPQSYTIPAELAEWKAWLDEQAAAGADPGPFMLKTAQHLGKGLVLLPGAAAYHAATQPRLPSAKPFVLAQHYVADPLLIDGCKFGIRLWLLITGVEPFTAYIHNHGLVLFSTDSFDMDSLSDQEGTAGKGHITNYAQNVNGTVWNLTMLKKHLGGETYRSLWAKMVRNAAHVACAALNEVREENSKQSVPPNGTFELLGLDYLVDSNHHPWLLEVNGTPSLAVSHHDPAVEQLIHEAKGSMVTDMFSILDVQHRFLPTYGLSKSGSKLSAMQAQRARIALSRHSEAAAKARVDAELQNRGGFIPLMGHFPVMQMQAAARGSNTVGDTQQAAGAVQGSADGAGSESDEDGDTQQQQQQPAGVGGVEQAAAGGQAAAGVHFSDADKRLFVYMQQWWQKHRAAGKRRRKRLKVAPAAAAAAAAPPEQPAAMQVDEQPLPPS